MKVTRFLVVSTVLVALAAAPVFAQSVGWTDQPVTVNINANMPELTQLRFDDLGATINLSEETEVLIGTMFERSNRTTGYTVSVSSASGGQLVGPGSEVVDYELRYGNQDEINLSSPVVLTTATNRTNFGGVERAVAVTPLVDLEADFLLAGGYTDTLTFT
ncbi:MAG: hypothetical protein EA428_11825, partial [Spirochaetaceae bacterium]